MRALLLHIMLFLVSTSCAQRPGDEEYTDVVIPRKGYWEPVELPTHPEQMAVLPSGKVLMWPWAPDRKTPRHGPVALWDPSDGTSTLYPGSGIESASGLAFQPDGVLLSAGGDKPDGGVDGNPRSFAFDHVAETLYEVAPMAVGRVAPGATTLATGEIIVTGGLDHDGHANGVPELWDGSTWRQLPDAFNDRSGWGTFQFLAPDGRLFRAGPQRLTEWLDVASSTWADTKPEHRNQIRHRGTAVMYGDGKILLAGGCSVGHEEGWYEQCRDTVLATAEVIDLRDPDPSWRPVAPMSYSRHSHHATLLPDGSVLITGGNDQPGLWHDESVGVLEAELWDPDTETFRKVAAMDKPHHFQSAAVLLPDGRVLVAGGMFGPNDDQPRFAWSGQIYSPAYLDRGPRLMVSGAPTKIRYESEFSLDISTPEAVSKVVLMGLSTSRVGWNGGQRMASLGFTADSHVVQIEAPHDPNVVPPGYYMLFVLSDRGVPSIGLPLRVGAD